MANLAPQETITAKRYGSTPETIYYVVTIMRVHAGIMWVGKGENASCDAAEQLAEDNMRIWDGYGTKKAKAI